MTMTNDRADDMVAAPCPPTAPRRRGLGRLETGRDSGFRIPLCLMLALVLVLQAAPGLPLSAAGAGQATPDQATPDIVVRTDLVYREVDGQSLSLTACLPAGAGPHLAAVVLVHGGGWRKGDKDTDQWRQTCEQFASRGFAAFSVNYRLAPKDIYPAAIEDVQAAIQWLREPAQVKAFGIDSERIGIFGGSAGGNLAALAGSRGTGVLTTGARVKAVVSLSGPMDLTIAALQTESVDPAAVNTVLTYLGCTTIDDCPASAGASPIKSVDATDPPFLLVNADHDRRVPAAQAQEMGKALDQARVPNRVIIVPGTDHALRLLGHPDIVAAVFTFFATYLAA